VLNQKERSFPLPTPPFPFVVGVADVGVDRQLGLRVPYTMFFFEYSLWIYNTGRVKVKRIRDNDLSL
jgi:hypothetical protein